MGRRQSAVRAAGQHRGDDERDHRLEVLQAALTRGAGHAPQIELVRLPGVQPIDGVTAVGQAGADEEQILTVCEGPEARQERRNHRRGLGAQDGDVAHVTGVASVPGDRIGRVTEAIVVVARGDHGARATKANFGAPGVAQGRDDRVDQELESVLPLLGIGEIADGERATELREGKRRDGRNGGRDGRGHRQTLFEAENRQSGSERRSPRPRLSAKRVCAVAPDQRLRTTARPFASRTRRGGR